MKERNPIEIWMSLNKYIQNKKRITIICSPRALDFKRFKKEEKKMLLSTVAENRCIE